MNTPHKHATILRAIADGLEVQFRKNESEHWSDMRGGEPGRNPITWLSLEWRIKPRMIVCGKHSWPEPMRVAPVDGTEYWVVSATGRDAIEKIGWNMDETDKRCLSRGLCHTTKEAAEQHVAALIAISQGDV